MTETVTDALSTGTRDTVPSLGLPLSSVIQTRALDDLFVPLDAEFPRRRGRVAVPFRGYWITVFADGRVTVRDEPALEETVE